MSQGEGSSRRRIPGPLVIVTAAAIAWVAAVAVPSLLNAVARGKQRRTMGDMRTIATALERWSMDSRSYLATSRTGEEQRQDLQRILVPTYTRKLPVTDGWGHPFAIVLAATEYTVTSYGRGGVPDSVEPQSVDLGGGTTSFDADIIFSTGSFVQFPDYGGD